MNIPTPRNLSKATEAQPDKTIHANGTLFVKTYASMEKLFSRKNIILVIGILIAIVISLWYPIFS